MRIVLLAVAAMATVLTGGCMSPFSDEASGVGDVEELRPKAAEITDLLVANDWKAVRADFDATMRKGLAEDGMANVWKDVVDENGAFVSRGKPTQIAMGGKYTVFDTPMTFERGDIKSRVAFHADGRIAGLFLLPPEAD